MKQLLVLCIGLFLSTTMWAQLELPQKSPKASTSFIIGLTKVTIAYSSPAVKERNCVGGLIPFDEVWRAGANEATTIEFSTDVMIEDTFLKKGKYSLFFIPKTRENGRPFSIKLLSSGGLIPIIPPRMRCGSKSRPKIPMKSKKGSILKS